MEKYLKGDHMKYNKISDKSEKYIFTVIITFSLIILAILFLINYILEIYIDTKFCYIVYSLILLDVIVTMILVLILPKIIYKNFGYYIDENKVESISGVIFLNRKIVLFRNIYKIIIRKKIIGRIFGISSLSLVTSAGEVKIYFLDEKGLESLYNKIILKIEEENCDKG